MLRARLHPTGNENMLQPLQDTLVVCLMAKYGFNMGRIIAIEIRDQALNGRETYLSHAWFEPYANFPVSQPPIFKIER